MENNSLFPFKYRLRKTGESVEIIAWETVEKGARSENDWVSYIDATGNEHVKEHLTFEWDFVVDNPFDSMMSKFEPIKLPELKEFDPWEGRRYELVKEMYFTDFDVDLIGYDGLVERADKLIAALKGKEEVVKDVQEDDGYACIGGGMIVEDIEDVDSNNVYKRAVFTDRNDIVGYKGDNGRFNDGDEVKFYIKKV